MEAPATEIAARPAWWSGLRRNDPHAVRALYKAHFPAVQRYVLQNSGTRSDAQDMFQEAMAVLWLKVKEDALPAEGDPGGFLYRVARHKWLDHLRSAARRHMSVVHDERLDAAQADIGDDAEEKLARLRTVYGALDAKCRKVLDQFYFERKPLAAIALDMGLTEESIRTIKYRCMMKLRAFRRSINGGNHEAG